MKEKYSKKHRNTTILQLTTIGLLIVFILLSQLVACQNINLNYYYNGDYSYTSISKAEKQGWFYRIKYPKDGNISCSFVMPFTDKGVKVSLMIKTCNSIGSVFIANKNGCSKGKIKSNDVDFVYTSNSDNEVLDSSIVIGNGCLLPGDTIYHNLSLKDYYGCDSVTIYPIISCYDGDCFSVLPVTWGDISCDFHDPYDKISWYTNSEINSDFFTIQKSYDGLNFEDVEEVFASGNSNIVVNYSVNVLNDFNELFYYRIKQTDFDGNYSFSKIFSNKNNAKDYFKIKNRVLKLNTGNRMVSFCEIFDITGNKIKSFSFKYSKSVDLNMRSGIYIIKIKNGNTQFLSSIFKI